MQLPEAFLDSLVTVKGFEKNTFVKVHVSGDQITSIRLNPFKSSEEKFIENTRFPIHEKITWTDHGYYLNERPSFTFDPLFHAGCYYVQEASSMFIEQVLKQTTDISKPLRVLDLCAAPGGKSTHLLSLISKDSLLVSNDVIRSRANILNDNIIKWGCSNVMVTNNDPRDFQHLESYFDVIVVDAPCSGSGLFRKDPEAIETWSRNNVTLCSQRQQRILADVLPSLKKGGVMIYSTCSYSEEEDEEIVKWLIEEFKVERLQLKIENNWGIVDSGAGYRFWPDKVKGEGFFISCFRKKDGEENFIKYKSGKVEKFSVSEMNVLENFILKNGLSFLRMGKMIHAIPENIFEDTLFLQSKLRVVNTGIAIGELIRGKLVPDHALAMSSIISKYIQKTELDFDQAIAYLKRKEIVISENIKGWGLVSFITHPLGWINILPNRINNYYPKMLRILKD